MFFHYFRAHIYSPLYKNLDPRFTSRPEIHVIPQRKNRKMQIPVIIPITPTCLRKRAGKSNTITFRPRINAKGTGGKGNYQKWPEKKINLFLLVIPLTMPLKIRKRNRPEKPQNKRTPGVKGQK